MTLPFVLAVPKGRILAELKPFFTKADIKPEAAFFDPESRALEFATDDPGLKIIRVRSFDVATFVAHGAAQLGICGADVLMEFDYPDLYAPLDLGIGRCRLSVACRAEKERDDPSLRGHVKIATKYPNLTRRHFSKRGIQAECIKLMGAVELAPRIGLCDVIVDLVGTGNTLKANGLAALETIAEISSQLIVNRAAFKTRSAEMQALITRFGEAL